MNVRVSTLSELTGESHQKEGKKKGTMWKKVRAQGKIRRENSLDGE